MEISDLFKVGLPEGAFLQDINIQEYFLGEEESGNADLMGHMQKLKQLKIRFLRMRNSEFW